MADGVKVVVNPAEIEGLLHEEFIRLALAEIGDQIAADAARNAPHRTGKGAESIHGEVSMETGEWVVKVSWTRERYYMRFIEMGTKYLPARPFLQPALDRYHGI